MWWYIVAASVMICFGFVVLRGAPYVPSHRRQLARAFSELYQLSSHDVLLDLGSGDGVVLRTASRIGAHSIGYELNPLLILISRLLCWRDQSIRIEMRDYMTIVSLPDEVTVVYAFTTSHSIEAIGRKMREWSADDRTLYLISYGFTLRSKKTQDTIGPMHLYRFANGQ